MSQEHSPNADEEAYFQKLAEEQKAKLRATLESEQAEEDSRKLREMHWMHCAKCGNEMATVNYRGVAIERCFNCGGVYLDDGELEKLAGEDRSGVLKTIGSLFRSKTDSETT